MSAEESYFQQCLRKMNESEEVMLRREHEKPFRAINVGSMFPYMNYEPRTLKELLEAYGKGDTDEQS